MTLILSMVLIGSSVLISSLIFNKRSRNETEADCAGAAQNMAARIDEHYYEFIAQYAQTIKEIYTEHYDELVAYYENGFDSRTEEKMYYDGLIAHLFPSAIGFGMSYEQLNFKNNFNDVLHELILVSKSFDTVGGYLYLYDAEHDYIVYMMDSTDEDSEMYMYPVSIQRPSALWKKNVERKKDPPSYVKKYGNGVSYCYGNSAVSNKETGEFVAYVGFNYDMSKLETIRKSFNRSISTIMLVVSAFITGIYLLFAEIFLIKNIRKLSISAAAFTHHLETNDEISVVNCGVRSNDEVGALSEQFGTMQKKIAEYVDAFAKKAEEEQRREAELSIAAEIQNEELPNAVYEDENVRVCASYTAAKEVAGDFYDFFYVSEKRVAVVIADVSGKGIPAALFMMKAKSLIKNKLTATGDLCKAMAEVNNALLENNKAGLFVTAFVGLINVDSGRMTCVSAGHEKPYLLKNGKAERLNVGSNFVLGGVKDFVFTENEVELAGGRLFLFTDGLNEAIDGEENEFGYERLEKTLTVAADLPQDETIALVQAELKAFVGDREPFDDVTILSIERNDGALRLRFDDPGFAAIEKATEAFQEAFPNLDKELRAKACVVLDEVLNNLISYEKREGFAVTLSAEEKKGALKLVFSSNGAPFDPLGMPEKKVETDDLPTCVGGFGITIAKNLSDAISYERKDERNVLTVSFRISK